MATKFKVAAFLSSLPESVYHAWDERVEVFDEKGLSFKCGCGQSHKTTDTIALCDSGLSNIAVYGCPNQLTFNIVKARGIFRINGLKTLDSFSPENREEALEVAAGIESRKKTL